MRLAAFREMRQVYNESNKQPEIHDHADARDQERPLALKQRKAREVHSTIAHMMLGAQAQAPEEL